MADLCGNEPILGANPGLVAPNPELAGLCDNNGVTSGIGTGGSNAGTNTIEAGAGSSGSQPAGGAGTGAGTGALFNSVFDVNKLAKALSDYLAINSAANSLFGYNFKWFRAVPQQRSKDVIFQEYTLYNVDECPLDIKAIIPGGTMPDSKYTYDLMGLEYEVPFEIQIDKKYWESIAGFGTAPQKKDIVYWPMANKLYQVESAYLFRGFMEQETTWKLNLIKYMPEAARREHGDSLKETIDMYTVSTEEIFGGKIESDIGKLTDDKQFSAMNGTSQDKYKKYDSELKTISESINIYGTVAAQSFYDMQTPIWYDAITYNGQDIITVDADRSLTAWVQPRIPTPVAKEFNVKEITSIVTLPDITMFDPSIGESVDASIFSSANYMITLDSPALLSQIQTDNNVVITRPGALNFYAKIVAISVNPLTYYCAINPFVLEDLQTIKSNWSSEKGYKLVVKEPISILDGVNDFGEHVLSVNVYANQYIAISYGHTYAGDDAYVVRLEEKLKDNQWYGIVVNIGNTWKQYSVYVWEKHPSDKNAKLQNIFYETLRLYPEHIAVDEYTINKSPAYLTNIRLFRCATLEEEKQSNELLSYFSQDGDQLIIGDNADQIMKLPYITKQR
jgi:hypothetical protein